MTGMARLLSANEDMDRREGVRMTSRAYTVDPTGAT
jgi:hypothetical protein